MSSLRDLSPAEMRQRATIFAHIPKTAGMTLRSILIRQYRIGEIFPLIEPHTFRQVMALPPQAKARYKLFQGHMSFGLHESLSQPSIYITMLRDPIQTVLSSYFFFELNYRRTQLQLQVEDALPTVADFENGKMKKMFDNLQTRFLSGQLKPEFGACTPEMLAQAKANLDRYFVFGLVEQFDEALVLMAERLGWRASPFYVKTNVARTRPRAMPGDDVMTWLHAHNQLDIELFAYAKTLFARLVAEQGDTFPKRVAEFRSRNKTYGRFFDGVSRAKNRTMMVLKRAAV
jgi:hypothetical protein